MILLFVVLLVAELLYFRLADRFRIVDKPKQRSSHSYITRRGGGIIFPLAWLIYSALNNFYLPLFTVGLLVISVISFWDDIKEVGVKTRISLHTIAISIAFYDLGLMNLLPWWSTAACIFISVAALNAINFMDGINGITGMYALVFWTTIAAFSGFFLQNELWSLSSPVPYIMAALIVFGFFNFRRKAVCFAGDVGSLSMAYLMIGIIAVMMFKPEGLLFSEVSNLKSGDHTAGLNLKYLLLLSVYGIDSFLTIIHRLILKENILKGHRKHLYQYLVNEYKLPHLVVASAYAALQLVISVYVLSTEVTVVHALTLLVILSGFYVLLKTHIMQHSAVQSQQKAVVTTTPQAVLPVPESSAYEKKQKEVLTPFIADSRTVAYKKTSHQQETSMSN